MNQHELEQLIDLARRRPLTHDEQARLTHLLEADPAAWPDRDDELALTRMLRGLPDAPLASNFSARVMQAIDLEEAVAARTRKPSSPAWRRWFIRLAGATAIVAISAISWIQYQHWQRAETAQSVKFITEVAAVPSVDILRDFDAVQSLSHVPPLADVQADGELLKALQ
ncbi:hypothetical protein GC207_03125 [bacterium]|nr:hypothetical protein [bacterium]